MANYHALQAGYRYTSHHGVTLAVAYTWSHTMTNNQGPQNPRDFQAEYGQWSNGPRQIFNAGYIWKMPFLKGRNDFKGKALGTWTFSGITSAISGPPTSLSMSTAAPVLTTRPNCIGPTSGPKTQSEWFNVNAFTNPAFGFFGNCANGNIYPPGLQVWDWALFKTFPIKERLKLQFRFEAFNLWNHPNFTGLSTGYGSGSFGQLTSALDPRQLEGALRLDF